ncbi:hypothetical protein EMPS_09017 [Entomortierella parvispora]|uniref:Velvet domain-containing protein n=1 Tax=Entomortierella parvispora TaxID=205924 RepID=A0A9P3LZW9_9FUNG|nr:hypothetical protein EMPS_09017 [Entomortierella parvispora]
MVKSSSSAPYCFVSGQTEISNIASSSKYVLTIRQQPQRAKVCGLKERDRRPIDPPPIVQIKLADPASDRNKDYLQSPYLFMCCNLVHADDPNGEIVAPAHRALAGTVVSSLNRLKDVDNSDGGFFVFGDISVRIEGHFRLRFSLFELIEGQVVHVMTSLSNALMVYPSKTFPGMSESTFLSRSFSDQGVRIRIRKDHHVKPKKALSEENDAEDSMHSPPPSGHEGEHSDSDVGSRKSVKRVKASPTYPPAGYSHARPIAVRPKQRHDRHSSAEPMDRTPPSSPGAFLRQDPIPSRPHHNPYLEESRRYEHHRSAQPYPSHYRPDVHPSYYSRYEGHPYRHDHGYPPYPSHPYHYHPYGPGSPPHHPSYPGHYSRGPQDRPRSPPEHRRMSYTSQEHGHYREGSPSYGYPPSHPMGAAHLSSSPPSPVHSSHPPVNAGRHGFPSSLLNEREMDYVPTPYHSRGPQEHHSRTPSMSSQHSEGGNVSPPHPFSPPESMMSHGHHSPQQQQSSLPSILPSLSRGSSGPSSEKVQLPPIHTLSTRSPVTPSHTAGYGYEGR